MEFLENIGSRIGEPAKRSLTPSEKKSLTKIIEDTETRPTIVNKNSRFVVVTYWWGRGNWNGNTARPCISFFEELINAVVKFTLKVFITIISDIKKYNVKSVDDVIDRLEQIVATSEMFDTLITNYAKTYMDSVFEYLELEIKYATLELLNQFSDETNEPDYVRRYRDRISDPTTNKKDKDVVFYLKYKMALKKLEGKDFILDELSVIAKDMKEIMITSIHINKKNIIDLYRLKKDVNVLEKVFLSERGTINETQGKEYMKNIQVLRNEKKKFLENIKIEMKKKRSYTFFGKEFQQSNIYDVLNKRFQYHKPIQFQTMIKNWEDECAKHHCNHLAVEYPEFAGPGGYQMAINAKPLFIKKALDLCPGRNVLYIDGDMFIRKYPMIFDMENVDFMARGWWIDPRSSYKLNESILYDPYAFETSGGTMFFSQSWESKKLLESWIELSASPKQQGKADDRILSLIFNSKAYLLNVNIIQLPIEYLWLTLGYNENLMENVYDYDKVTMEKTIFIEHPECLTSEETASGAGASSDRTPMFYQFLDNESTFVPVSEEFHEYFMFPTKEMKSSFEPYLTYMSEKQYINDGNEQLLKKKFVDPENEENNEYPMYVIPYDKKFGKRQSIVEKNMEIVRDELNTTYLNRSILKKPKNAFGFVELDETAIPGKEYEIPMIISLLSKGHNIIYKPTEETIVESVPMSRRSPATVRKVQGDDYTKILLYKNTNLELVFFPDMAHMDHNLKPAILLSKPILFLGLNDHGRQLLINALSMFHSLAEFSEYLKYGSYQIISRIRIGYVFSTRFEQLGGSPTEKKLQFMKEYETGLKLMYPPITRPRRSVYVSRRIQRTNVSKLKKSNRMTRRLTV